MEIGFKRASLGYNPEEVDKVIDKFIAERKLKDMQLEEHRAKIQELESRFESLEKQQVADRTLIADTMIAARQDAGKVLGLAQNEADRIVSEANDRAKTIISDAHQESTRIITEAGKVESEIHHRINSEYLTIKTAVLGVAESSRSAKTQLTQMFETSESTLIKMLDNLQLMLPETASASDSSANIESGMRYVTFH